MGWHVICPWLAQFNPSSFEGESAVIETIAKQREEFSAYLDVLVELTLL